MGYPGSLMAPMAELPKKGTAPQAVKAIDCASTNKISVINIGSMQDEDKMQTAREELATPKPSGKMTGRLDGLSIKMVGNGVGVLVDAKVAAREEAARARARMENKHQTCNLGDICGANYTEEERVNRAKTIQ